MFLHINKVLHHPVNTYSNGMLGFQKPTLIIKEYPLWAFRCKLTVFIHSHKYSLIPVWGTRFWGTQPTGVWHFRIERKSSFPQNI